MLCSNITRNTTVLVCLGCDNKIPQTSFLFLTVLGAENPRPRCQHGQVLALTGWQTAGFLLCPHMAEGGRDISGVSFIRALILFMRAVSPWLSHIPKALLSKIIIGIRFSTYEFEGETKNIWTAEITLQYLTQTLLCELFCQILQTVVCHCFFVY